jgi:hypothetical protein
VNNNFTAISATTVNTGLGNDNGFNRDEAIFQAIREKLASNMRTGFVELVPQEVFDKMTDLAIDEFVNGPRSKRFKANSLYLGPEDPRNTTGKHGYVTVEVPIADYNPVADKTTLPGMIFEEISNKAKENIAETLKNMPEFNTKYDADVGRNIVPLITDIVANNAGAFMTAMMNGVIQHTFIEAINAMRNGNGMNSYSHPLPKVRF